MQFQDLANRRCHRVFSKRRGKPRRVFQVCADVSRCRGDWTPYKATSFQWAGGQTGQVPHGGTPAHGRAPHGPSASSPGRSPHILRGRAILSGGSPHRLVTMALTQAQRRELVSAWHVMTKSHPSRRMFSSAPAGGHAPLVPTRFTEVHISSPVSSMCLRAKDHLEGTKVAVFLRYCAPQEVQSGSAADWRSPRSGDQEDDGRSSYPKKEQATQCEELSGRRRHATATYGLHRSWWTLVSARGGNRHQSAQPCGSPRAGLGASSVASSRETQRCADASAKPRKHRVVPIFPTVPERSRSLRQVAGSLHCNPMVVADAHYRQIPAFGLYMSSRHLVPLGGGRDTRVRPTASYEHQNSQAYISSY